MPKPSAMPADGPPVAPEKGAAVLTRPQAAGGVTDHGGDKPLAPVPVTSDARAADMGVAGSAHPAPAQGAAAPSPEQMVPESRPDEPGAPIAGLPRGVVREILLAPDPRLRMAAAPVAGLRWPELAQLAADLLATLYAAGGRGLAAPQIGVAHRIFVMDSSWKTGPARPRIILDPDIVERAKSYATLDEGCLSIPGHVVAVTRPAAIRLRWFTLDGEAVLSEWSGIDARIAQHEIDHLNGVLITDHDNGSNR